MYLNDPRDPYDPRNQGYSTPAVSAAFGLGAVLMVLGLLYAEAVIWLVALLPIVGGGFAAAMYLTRERGVDVRGVLPGTPLQLTADDATVCHQVGDAQVRWKDSGRALVITHAQTAGADARVVAVTGGASTTRAGEVSARLSVGTITITLSCDEAMALLSEAPAPLTATPTRVARFVALESAPTQLTLRLTLPPVHEAVALRELIEQLAAWLGTVRWQPTHEAMLRAWVLDAPGLPEHARSRLAEAYLETIDPVAEAEGFSQLWAWLCAARLERGMPGLIHHPERFFATLPATAEGWREGLEVLVRWRGEAADLQLREGEVPRWALALGAHLPDAVVGDAALTPTMHRITLAVLVRVAPERLPEALRQLGDLARWQRVLHAAPRPWPAVMLHAIAMTLPEAVLTDDALDEVQRRDLVGGLLATRPDALLPRLTQRAAWELVLSSVDLSRAPDALLHQIAALAPSWQDQALSARARHLSLVARLMALQRHGEEGAAALTRELDAAHAALGEEATLGAISQGRVSGALPWVLALELTDMRQLQRAVETATLLHRVAPEAAPQAVEAWTLDRLRHAVAQAQQPHADGLLTACAALLHDTASPAALRTLGELLAQIEGHPHLGHARELLRETIRTRQRQLGGDALGALTLSVGGEGGQLTLSQSQSGELTEL